MTVIMHNYFYTSRLRYKRGEKRINDGCNVVKIVVVITVKTTTKFIMNMVVTIFLGVTFLMMRW